MELGWLVFVLVIGGCACAAYSLGEVDRGGLRWKAAHYERAMQVRHLRDGGMVIGGVAFPNLPGWEWEDDENSAYLTGAYLASLSFRYAATGEPEAREQADRCATTLKRLVDITGSPGFLARWYRPVNPQAPEKGWLGKSWSTAGEYRWLGNPSTDQYTGVCFGLSVYYDLAADEQQRQMVAGLAGAMAGRILEAGMKILDPEGKPTSWFDMSPETMQEPLYAPVALHLLAVGHQATGEQRFRDAYLELATQHDYLGRSVKLPEYTSWNRSDDVMSFESFYTTITQEKDPGIRERLLVALRANWEDVRRDGRFLFGVFYDGLVPGAGQAAEAIQELVDYPSHKIEIKGTEAVPEPVPSWQRSYGWFELMCDTRRRIVGSEQSGVDYLLAYWMARYHGLIG